MKDEDVPPQFRETKQPEPPSLFEELPIEPPADVPPPEPPPARAPEPYLRQG